MARDSVTINSKKYRIAHGRNGERLWSVTPRPSQPGDPGGMGSAEWTPYGSDLGSFEGDDGYLGRDYGSNTDGRNYPVDTIGPKVNTITAGAYDATHNPSVFGTPTMVFGSTAVFGSGGAATNADGIALRGQYAIAIRGRYPVRVALSDMSVSNTGRKFTEPATSVLTTRTESGVTETAVGLGEQAPYEVITELGTPANSDTWVPNDDGEFARIFGLAPDRIAVLTAQRVRGNVLSGAVTMRSPNIQTIAPIAGEEVTFTGFAMDADLWFVATSNGPYLLDSATAKFHALMPEIDNDSEHGRATVAWSQLGVIFNSKTGERYFRYGEGESFGTRRFRRNTSPVQGFATAFAPYEGGMFEAKYNERTGNTYIIDWRPRQAEDPHGMPLSPHTVAVFPSLRCNVLRDIGTVNGLRTNPTVLGGYGSNLFWMTRGRTEREIDDSNYRFATAGTTYLTELRREPAVIKDIEAIEFETASCTANRTVIPAISIDGATAVALSTVTSNGFQRIYAVDTSTDPDSPLATLQGGRRIKPELRYATNVDTSAPQVLGKVRVYWRWRPLMVNAHEWTLDLDDEAMAGTTEEQGDQLLALWGSAPVLVAEDLVDDTYYVRIDGVRVYEVAETGGGDKGSDRGSRRYAQIKATEWRIAL